MKKALTSAFVITFVVVMSFVLGTGSPAQAGHYDRYHHRPTILDKLVSTDGAQALVAAVLVVDGICPQIGELLDDRRAKLTLLAPNNSGFEEFLDLPPGKLDGLSIGTIVGFLKEADLDADAVCGVLLNHVSVRGAQSTRALLKKGQIKVLGSEVEPEVYPVAIGGPAGVWINYQNAITEADVVAANGVIYYLDSVIADDPPPPPPDLDTVCDQDLCTEGSDLQEEYETFLVACLAEESANEEECIGGALLICSEI